MTCKIKRQTKWMKVSGRRAMRLARRENPSTATTDNNAKLYKYAVTFERRELNPMYEGPGKGMNFLDVFVTSYKRVTTYSSDAGKAVRECRAKLALRYMRFPVTNVEILAT